MYILLDDTCGQRALLYVPCASPIASCMLDLLIPSATVPPGLTVQHYCVSVNLLSSSEHV